MLRVRGISRLGLLVLSAALFLGASPRPVLGQTIAGCDVSTTASPIATSTNCGSDGSTLDLSCVALPDTGLSSQPDFDIFAWNSFVALNWPAVIPQKNNYQRGIPNKNKSFSEAEYTDLGVWETYTEKREVFFYNNNEPPNIWNKCVQYGGPPPDPKNPKTSCTGAGRAFMQPLKVTFTDLDETIEVASEAQESGAVLCQGHAMSPDCDGSEDEPACCKVNGMAVGPRVWKGEPATDVPPSVSSATPPVVYEVKVNYDFYEYVVQNSYYLDTKKNMASQAGDITLPARTSAGKLPGPNPGTAGYSAKDCADQYPQNVDPTGNIHPCASGSVHVKAAWIRLDPKQIRSGKYHVSQAVYFSGEDTEPEMGNFGLVGLHIIQRIHTGTTGTGGQTGGTFIFATWEHVDNDTAGFTYSNYLPYAIPTTGTKPPFPKKGFYPTPKNAIPVTRRFNMLANTCTVNQQVHAAIKEANPDSVWLNYALIGTQFLSVDGNDNPASDHAFPAGPNDPTGIGQPFYLANSLIETNDGLQHFQGQPPQLDVISHYSRVRSNSTYDYVHGAKNGAFEYNQRGQSYLGTNMGGCMGCHGVAQLKGTAFSFVLLLGQEGAKPDSQLEFDVPAEPTVPQSSGSP